MFLTRVVPSFLLNTRGEEDSVDGTSFLVGWFRCWAMYGPRVVMLLCLLMGLLISLCWTDVIFWFCE